MPNRCLSSPEEMMQDPKLSIVVPSLNQGSFIEETLSSLVNQECVSKEQLEVIVIDGGSSDQTLDILRKFGGRIDYWISERDGGQTDALRKGFSVATGNLLGWLCADDLLTPRAVKSVLDFFAATPHAAFVYGDALWIAHDGCPEQLKREIPFNWFIWLNDHNYIPQPAAFWRRDLYDAVGGVDSSFEVAMDTDLFARFALKQKPWHVSQVWALMRRYPEQKNQRLRNKSNQEDNVVRGRHGVASTNRAFVTVRFATAKAIRVAWKVLSAAYVPKPILRRIWARETQRSARTK
jgi:glycosyltransferase involved in cell wall biosynthesis